MKPVLIIMILFIIALEGYAQNSGRIYTEEEVRQAIKRATENCDCPDEQEPMFIAADPGSAGSVTIMLMGGLNYLYGSDGTDDLSLNSDYLSWQGEAMIGYAYKNSSGGEGASFGLFIRGGALSGLALEKLMIHGEINESFLPEDENIFYQIEGGIIIAGFLRISSGLGFQEYQSASDNLNRIAYYSTTPGILIGSNTFKLSIDVNLMYGRDLQQTVYKPGIGLAIKF